MSDTLKTKVLTGKDTVELDQQQWELQSSVAISKAWPDESLPLQFTKATPGNKIASQDLVSRRVDYHEK
jgi:hypothetical protein